jgi:anhydro-N-acetylmuramic acid kinase
MPENKVYTAIGLMSGTSLDGIDVALVRTDGMEYTEMLDFQMFPYEDEVQETIKFAFGSRFSSDITRAASKVLTQAHIDAVKAFIAKIGCEADVIGFHGQTILHDPSQKFTWQIGDSAALATAVGIDVVGDMRVADVKAGGQGAPLLPICHRAFASDIEKPIAILNLGGVGNITWLGQEQECANILAFDTGPANALIDDLVKARIGKAYDSDGTLARSGKPKEKMIKMWLDHEYFKKMPPKSLDRDEWNVSDVEKLKLEDAVATLAEFTVRSIVRSFEQLPNTPRALYVAGGGRHNIYMMERLRQELSFTVDPVEALGWNGDALEAQGFAYLAVRSLLKLPLTLPSTTGVAEPMTGGVLYHSSDSLALRPA